MTARIATLTAAAVTGLVVLSGCGGTSEAGPRPTAASWKPAPKPDPSEVSKKSMGAAWPLTIDHGRLECIDGSVILVTSDGNYAVNGTTKDNPHLKHVADIDEVWADDKDLGMGLKKDISPLVDRGLALC
jgi:hypothetical protein